MEKLIKCKQCDTKFNVYYYGERFNRIWVSSPPMTYDLDGSYIGGCCPECGKNFVIKEKTGDDCTFDLEPYIGIREDMEEAIDTAIEVMEIVKEWKR